MSLQAKRELLAQVSLRYREVTHTQKSVILDEFVAATGYVRKYAIRLLARPVPPATPIRRPRARQYTQAVQDALAITWAAANFICAKRLVPFLPELVPILECHGHLQVSAEVRTLLLRLSPATAERLLKPRRQSESLRGKTTTKPGKLLKHQVPIRTFSDWNETKPGFFEADLVAHCGWSVEGSFLYTLVLTDIVTGWTECFALLQRSQHNVVQALERAQPLLPFPILGIDTDNGLEFINAELLAYCEQTHVTFTRGRTAKKNDQCFVEQKNGVIVRQFVGYDRFDGERAYHQLTELYRALRLYVNFFQPSMKLLSKRREGSKVHRKYDRAQTPLQRLLATTVLTAEVRTRLENLRQSLDPVRLLQQIQVLQDALWRQAIYRTPEAPLVEAPTTPITSEDCFNLATCSLGAGGILQPATSAAGGAMVSLPAPTERQTRHYHRAQKSRTPRDWRTRADPFSAVWEEVCVWLKARPERTAKSVFLELQQRYPDQFPDSQLRTMQRRVQDWRTQIILSFDDPWSPEEVLSGQRFPRPLQVLAEISSS